MLKHRRTIIVVVALLVSLLLCLPVSAAETYTVQPGDTLSQIAQRYGVSVTALASANGITNPNQIYWGLTLTIPDSGETPPPATSGGTHTVQRGETLASIARAYGLTWPTLAQANGITNPNLLYFGQVLVIPGSDGSTTPAPAPAPVTGAPSGATTYTVQAGDTLARIAARYNLTWPTLAQANGLANPNNIYRGQVLTIPAAGSAPVVTPPPPPIAQPAGERWVDVNLSTQTAVAYEGNTPVRYFTVSTGLPATPTVVGQFRVYLRYQSQTMSGYDYYLPNVPYVMYFYQGYGLHGTYWHNNFGQPMSHGCVNMRTEDAQWLYYWSDYGMLVNVHY